MSRRKRKTQQKVVVKPIKEKSPYEEKSPQPEQPETNRVIVDEVIQV